MKTLARSLTARLQDSVAAVQHALRRPAGRHRRQPCLVFEPLEPRLLLSADPLTLTAVANDQSPDLLLTAAEQDGETVLQLIDRTQASPRVVAQALRGEVERIRVQGTDLDDRLEVDASIADDAGLTVRFDGGAGTDTLVGPECGRVWTLTAGAAGSGGDIDFSNVERLVGGDGQDTLEAQDSRNDWRITGADSGVLNGVFEFAGMESLVGGANDDVFVIESGGSVSGGIDTGAGEHDLVKVWNDDLGVFTVQSDTNFESAGTTAPQAGGGLYKTMSPSPAPSAPLEGELLASQSGTPAADIIGGDGTNRIVYGTGADDDIVIESSTATGAVQVRFVDTAFWDGSQYVSVFEFANPTESLAVYTLDGGDSVEVQGLDAQFDADLRIYTSGDPATSFAAQVLKEDGDSDSVTFKADLSLPNGALDVVAERITLEDNVDIDTGAGDIRLRARDTGVAQLDNAALILALSSRDVAIKLGDGASLTSTGEVQVIAEALDLDIAETTGAPKEVSNFLIGPLLEKIADLTALPVKVLSKSSTARVNIGAGAEIDAGGDVVVRALTEAIASGKAQGILASVGYGYAGADAQIAIADNAQILSSGGAVEVLSDARATADIEASTARLLGDLPAPTLLKISLSLGVSNAEVVSKVNMGTGALIDAAKTANLKSDGLIVSQADAFSGTYADGSAGFAFAFDFADADVNTRVDGTVIARNQGSPVLTTYIDPLAPEGEIGNVDYANDRIYIGSNAYSIGDGFRYDNSRGTSIGNMVDEREYFIAANDDGWIQLSETRTGALRASVDAALDSDILDLKDLSGTIIETASNEKAFEAGHVDAARNTIALQRDDNVFNTFQLGEAVRYDARTNSSIAGLEKGKTYYVIAGIDQQNLQGNNRLVDTQVIQLAETHKEALAGVAIDIGPATGDDHLLTVLHVMDFGVTTGVGVLAELDSEVGSSASAGGSDDDDDDDSVLSWSGVSSAFSKGLVDVLLSGLTVAYSTAAAAAQAGAPPALSAAGALSLSFVDQDVTSDVLGNAVLKSNEDVEVVAAIEQTLLLDAESNLEEPESAALASSASVSIATAVGDVSNDALATVHGGAQIDALQATRVIADVRYPFQTRFDEFIPLSWGELTDSLRTDGAEAITKYLNNTLGFKDAFFNTWVVSTAEGEKLGIAGSVAVLDLDNNSQAIVKNGALINQNTGWRDNTVNPHVNQAARQSDGKGDQVVSVEARTYQQMINMSGVFKLPELSLSLDPVSTPDYANPGWDIKKQLSTDVGGTEGGRGGAGGGLLLTLQANTTHAIVEDGAAICSGADGGFNLKAEEALLNVNLAQSYAKGGTFTIGGSVVYTGQASDTLAQLGSGAQVTGRNAKLYAGDLTTNANWAGGIAKSEATGVGVSVAINDFERSTRALIGAEEAVSGSAVSSTTSIDVTEDIEVKARVDGDIWAFTIAGTVSKPQSRQEQVEEAQEKSEDALDGAALPILFGEMSNADQTATKVQGARTGIGFAGASSVNLVNDEAIARIADAGHVKAGSVSVLAENGMDLLAVTGGLAVVTAGNNTSAALAGAYSHAEVTQNTLAEIQDTDLTLSGLGAVDEALVIEAIASGSIVAAAAGGAGAKPGTDPTRPSTGNTTAISLAGSVALNDIAGDTNARLINARVIMPHGNARVFAEDDSGIFTIAGGLSLSLSKGTSGGATAVSAGVALAFNDLDVEVAALIDGSTIGWAQSTLGDLTVKSVNDRNIGAYTLAGAVSVASGTQGKGIAGAGAASGSVNNIVGDTLASVHNSTSSVPGTVTVRAEDDADIIAGAGGISASVGLSGTGNGGSGAFGAAFAINAIGEGSANRIWADVEASSITARAIAISAESSGEISAHGVGVAGSVSKAGQGTAMSGSLAGSIGVNAILVDTQARARAASSLSATDAGEAGVLVSARDSSTILAVGGVGNLSIAVSQNNAVAAGLGVSVSVNEITSNVEASIVDTPVVSAADVTVSAESESDIDSRAHGVALGVSISKSAQSISANATGAMSFNEIDSGVVARIADSEAIGTATVAADGDIAVTADNDAKIEAEASAAAASISGSTSATSISVAIGIAIADNEIDTETSASLVNLPSVTTDGGSVTVSAANNTEIDAFTLAASAAVGVSSSATGVGATGGSATATNSIAGKTTAFIDNSVIGLSGNQVGDVTVRALDTATIDAAITGVAVALGASSSGTGAAIALGLSLAFNGIGEDDPMEVSAYLQDSAVHSDGALAVSALTNARIDADVAAVAVGIGGSGSGTGASFTAGGAAVTNDIRVDVSAYIKGDAGIGVRADTITVTARDLSSMSVFADAASVSLGLGNTNGAAVAVGAAVVLNKLDVDVSAYVDGATVTATEGDVAVRASQGVVSDIAVGAASADALDAAAREGEAATIDGVRSALDAAGLPLEGDIRLGILETGKRWALVDAGGNSYLLWMDNGVLKARVTSVVAVASATSVSFGAGGTNGVAVSGAGAYADNIVLSDTKAYIKDSAVTAGGDVLVDADNLSSIFAGILTVAASVGGGGTNGAGVSIGVSIAKNRIGRDENDSRQGAATRAFIQDSSIDAAGALIVDADAEQTISAVTITGGVALAGGGTAGAAAAVNGAWASNLISADVEASIEGDSGSGIDAGSVSVTADDKSKIASTVGAASVAAAFGGTGGVALTIGVALASNEIDNKVTAHIADVDDLDATGHVVVTANESAVIDATAVAASIAASLGGVGAASISGAGAVAVNMINTDTRASIANSDIHAGGNVTVTADNDASIEALIGSVAVSFAVGGTAGVGAAIGVALAANLLGYSYDNDSVGLNILDTLADTNDTTREGMIVRASVDDTDLYAGGALLVRASTQQTIDAETKSGAAAVAAGGEAGLGASGAGANAVNHIGADVLARISGTDNDSVSAAQVTVEAKDDSSIDATVGASALTAAFGGVGAGASVAVALAENLIDNSILATVENLGQLNSRTDTLAISASENADIDATSTAAAIAISGGVGALSISGAGAEATNIILGSTAALVKNTRLVGGVGIDVTATNTSTIDAEIEALADSFSVGGIGIAVAVGASDATNLIGYDRGQNRDPLEVRASLERTDVSAGNDLTVEAQTSQTIKAAVEADSVAVSAGIGAASGAGAGVDVLNKIAADVTASINRQRSSGIDADGVQVTAQDSSIVDADAGAASVAAAAGLSGSIALSVALAENRIDNSVTAAVRDADLNLGVNGLTLHALENVDVTSETQAAAVAAGLGGGVSGGGAETKVRVTTDTKAVVERGSVTTLGDIQVRAYDTSDLHAEVKSVSAALGLIAAAANGSVATISASPTIYAGIDGSAVDAVEVAIEAEAKPKLYSYALGFAVSSGHSIGVSRGAGSLTSDVVAQLGGNIQADEVKVSAIHALPSNGKSVEADATGSAGGVLLGVNATLTSAETDSTVIALVSDHATLDVDGDILIEAASKTSQDADADSNAFGYASSGATNADAESDSETMAWLGDGVSVQAQNLSVIAEGHDSNLSRSEAGSGGAFAGAAAISSTDTTSTVIAGISSGSGTRDIKLRGAENALVIKADHLSEFDGKLETSAGGALAGSGGDVTHNVDSTVIAVVANDQVIEADSINISAENRVEKDLVTGKNVDGSAAALSSGGGIDSDTTLTLDTDVAIGKGAKLSVAGIPSDADLINLSAKNSIDGDEKVVFKAIGAISGAGTSVDVKVLEHTATVSIGDNAEISSAGRITASARGEGELAVTNSAEASGAAAKVTAKTNVEIAPENAILIGEGAKLTADGQLLLSAGSDTDFDTDRYTVESRADTYSTAVIPLEDATASARVEQSNEIVIEKDALLTTAREARIHAARMPDNVLAVGGKSQSWAPELLPSSAVVMSEGVGVSLTDALITMDGTVKTGENRKQKLIIKDVDDETGEVSDYEMVGDIRFTSGTATLQSDLVKDLQRAQANLLLYPDHETLTAFYEKEIERLKGVLGELGLLDEDAPNGLVVGNEQQVATVTIEPIHAEAGVIDLRADQITGTGQWIAPSDADITLINETPLFMNIKGISMPATVGGLYLNGVLVEDNTEIKKANTKSAENDDKLLQLDPGTTEVQTSTFARVPSQSSTQPEVYIETTKGYLLFDGATAKPGITILSDDDGGSGIDTPSANVTLKTPGDITIENDIDAANITVIAGGTVYINGVSTYHVGGNPSEVWAEFTEGPYGNLPTPPEDGSDPPEDDSNTQYAPHLRAATADEVEEALSLPPYVEENIEEGENGEIKRTGGAIFANKVIVKAGYLNISGVIQSGYEDYDLVLDADMVARDITEYADDERDRVFLKETSEEYRHYDVFFRQSTQTIEVNELKVGAGSIDIDAHIMNTGNGEIRVFGGYADIEIDNETDYDLKIFRVDQSSAGSGTLVLKDSSYGYLTVNDVRAAADGDATQAGYVSNWLKAYMDDAGIAYDGTPVISNLPSDEPDDPIFGNPFPDPATRWLVTDDSGDQRVLIYEDEAFRLSHDLLIPLDGDGDLIQAVETALGVEGNWQPQSLAGPGGETQQILLGQRYGSDDQEIIFVHRYGYENHLYVDTATVNLDGTDHATVGDAATVSAFDALTGGPLVGNPTAEDYDTLLSDLGDLVGDLSFWSSAEGMPRVAFADIAGRDGAVAMMLQDANSDLLSTAILYKDNGTLRLAGWRTGEFHRVDNLKDTVKPILATIYSRNADGTYTVSRDWGTGSETYTGADLQTLFRSGDEDATDLSTYSPEDGWRYGWTVGLSERETLTYTVTTESWSPFDFDLFQFGMEIDADDWTVETLDQPKLLDDSDFFFLDDGTDAPYLYAKDKIYTYMNAPQPGEPSVSTNWWGEKTIKVTFTKTNGYTTQHSHSISASRPIAINFLGSDEGSIDIDAGAGNLILGGPVVNPEGTTTLRTQGTITAQGGLGETPYVGGRVIELYAGQGIGSSTLNPLETRVTDGGSDEQKASAGVRATTTYGDIYLNERLGDTGIAHIDAARGDFVYTATGSINASTTGDATIRAINTTLTSEDGGVGNGSGRPVKFTGTDTWEARANPGSVKIDAKGGVAIAQVSGDLSLDHIHTEGDVSVRVYAGDLLDANDDAIRDERTYEELKGGVWADLALTADSGADAKIAAAKASTEQFKTTEYHDYWQYRNTQADPSVYDAGHQVSLTAEEADYYAATLGYSEQQIADLEAERSERYHLLHADYGALGDTYDADFSYELSAEEEAEYESGFKVWSEAELLYSISAGLLATVTDTQVEIETANIQGANIEVIASGNAGVASETMEIDLTKLRVAPVEANMSFSGDQLYSSGTNWAHLGFEEGHQIFIEGAGDNNGAYVIREISGYTLMLDVRDGDDLVAAELLSTSTSGVTVTITLSDDERVALAGAERADVSYESRPLNISGYVRAADGVTTIERVVGADLSILRVGDTIRVEVAGAVSSAAKIVSMDGNDIELEGSTGLAATDYVGMNIILVAPDPGSASTELITLAKVSLVEDIDITATGDVSGGSGAQAYFGSESLVKVSGFLAQDEVRFKTSDQIRRAGAESWQKITAEDVVLEASSGTIGTASNPMLVHMTGDGALTARALADIHIDSETDLGISTIYSASGGVFLDSEGDIHDALNHALTNIQANVIVLNADAGIGETDDHLDTEIPAYPSDPVAADGTGTITATADGTIWLADTAGEMRIRNVLSRGGDVHLKSAGDMVDSVDLSNPTSPTSGNAPNDLPERPAADVIGSHVHLIAGGDIGAPGNHLDIRAGHSGISGLSADAAGDIRVVQTAGNVGLGSVVAGGYAELTTLSGGFTDLDVDDSDVDLSAERVRIYSAGGFGTAAQAIETDISADPAGAVDAIGTGTLTVRAGGAVNLAEMIGDLHLRQIVADGEVRLYADQNIVDAVDLSVPTDVRSSHAASTGSRPAFDVLGSRVWLSTGSGDVGSVDNFIDIDARSAGLSGQAHGDVFVREVTGNMAVGALVSNEGHVYLTTVSGHILEDGDDSEADIQAASIDLDPTDGRIGDATNPIEIFGAGNGVQAASGVANGWEIDALELPDAGRLVAQATGGLHLMSVGGAFNVLQAVSHDGDLSMGTRDSGLHGEILSTLATGTDVFGQAIASGVISADGDIHLDVGDGLTVVEGSGLLAGGAILVEMDSQEIDPEPNPDPGSGGTIDISGQISANSARMLGGDDLDFFQVRTALDGGSVTMEGTGADDRFFVSASGGGFTLAGGEGADRFYIAGNAHKGLFEADGFFDDTDPFAKLAGSLDGITGVVSIDTGAGGTGGTEDAIYVADGANDSSTIRVGADSVTGLLGNGRIDYVSDGGMTLSLGLGGGNDSATVTSANANQRLYVYGGEGDDELNVGNADGKVDDIDGIVGFFGEAGTDVLNVHGDASETPDGIGGQVTAINVTGMGMGRNDQIATHNDVFEADYRQTDADWPGAIYFATGSGESTVEQVHVHLGAGDDAFRVDSSYAYGSTTVHGGAGADTLTVGSSAAGLQPESLGRVDFIAGEVRLLGDSGPDRIIIDDSGDDNANTGSYLGDTVTGLDMPGTGAISFGPGDDVEIRLGAQADTFYVPAVSANVSVSLLTGGGMDSVHVGATEGNTSSGNLDQILGSLTIEGQGPEAGDQLFFNDQANTANQTFRVDNAITGARTLVDQSQWPVDTTTVTRTGWDGGEIQYRGMEIAVINAGQGDDRVDLMATHREQSVAGGASSFVVNAGPGDDQVRLGRQVAGGYDLEGFALDLGLPSADSNKGIPVLVHGQGGSDSLVFLDDASDADTNVGFESVAFADIFPDSQNPGSAAPDAVSDFTAIFGDDPTAAVYSTVSLQRDGGVPSTSIHGRDVEELAVNLGDGDDNVQLQAGSYVHGMRVHAGGGQDTFIVESGVDTGSNAITLAGESGDDELTLNLDEGWTGASSAIHFSGGTQDADPANGRGGDRLHLVGDGSLSGVEYRPSTTQARAGTIVADTNATLSFDGIEPLLVHGLPDFEVVTGDGDAELALDTVTVDDLSIPSLALHTVTVEGVVTWSQQTKLVVDNSEVVSQMAGVMSLDGDTLAVGAPGVVMLYQASNGNEIARLRPSDRYDGGGEGFGASVHLDGDTLLVGAPEDDERGEDAGAVYVFERIDDLWTETGKLIGDDTAAGDAFGSSVTLVETLGTATGISFDDGANDLSYSKGGYYTNWTLDDTETASGEGNSLRSGTYTSTSEGGQVYSYISFSSHMDGSLAFRYAFDDNASSTDRIEVRVGTSTVATLYAGTDYTEDARWRSFEYDLGEGYKNIELRFVDAAYYQDEPTGVWLDDIRLERDVDQAITIGSPIPLPTSHRGLTTPGLDTGRHSW